MRLRGCAATMGSCACGHSVGLDMAIWIWRLLKVSAGGTGGALLLSRAARGTRGGPRAEARPTRVSRDARAPLRKH